MNELLFLIGLLIGQTLPDVDLAPLPLWRHRSWLTHGVLLPVCIYWLSQSFVDYRWLWVGLLSAVAVHLLNDAGPKAWRGSAMINFYPMPLSLHPALSVAYIGAGALVAALLCVRLYV
jgi:membrane-bound metal-dependent hydrolase YbcI (DUF457 family)